MTKSKNIKKDKKTVTIVMPVGVDAGKKVKVTEKRAKEIDEIFGTYAESGASAAIADTSNEAELNARIVELETLVVTVGEVGAAIDLLFEQAIGEAPKDGSSLLDKITQLTELLSSEPDGDESGDGVKGDGDDNG